MLGQVICRVWVVALLYLSSLCLPSRATAVQMPDPDLLLSETCLMLAVVEDLPATIVQGKAFFDHAYREYREQGVLRPLDTPTTQYYFGELNCPRSEGSVLHDVNRKGRPGHWLMKAVDSIATKGTELESVWRPIADKLVKDPSRVTADDEDEVVRAFAALFSGKLFIAEEDFKPYRTTVFGFEYDPKVFDWMREFRLVAERQREQYGYDDDSATISGVEVVHLPNEGWYVFSIGDVIYGVAERQLEKTPIYLTRAIHLNEGRKPTWDTLRSDRRFRRAVNGVSDFNEKIKGISFYVSFNDFFSRISQRTSSLNLRFAQQAVKVERPLGSPFDFYACYSCRFEFSSDGRSLEYVVANPLYKPGPKAIDAVHAEFGDVDIPKSIILPSTVNRMASVRLLHSHPSISTAEQYNRLSPLPLSFLGNKFETSVVWSKDNLDFISIIEGVIASEGVRIDHLAFEEQYNGCWYVYPGVMSPYSKFGNIEDMLREFRDYCTENEISTSQLFKDEGMARWWVEWPREALPQCSVSQELEIPTSSFGSVGDDLAVLAETKLNGCRVAYVGNSGIRLVMIESGGNLFILPYCTGADYILMQVVEKLTHGISKDVVVPSEFHQLFAEGMSVKQLVYQTHFDVRASGVEFALAMLPDGGLDPSVLIEFIEPEFNETVSFAYLLRRCVLNTIGLADNLIEKKCPKFQRSTDPIDWFRAFVLHNDNMIQIGSMKFRDQLKR